MPTATVPVGRPVSPAATPAQQTPEADGAKPAGFTMPTGLSRQTASNRGEEEEEEEKGLQPVHLGISIASLLAALLFCYSAYSADRIPNRVSDYLFGQPAAADSSGGGEVSSTDAGDTSEDNSGSEEDESSSDEEGEEEEEEE